MVAKTYWTSDHDLAQSIENILTSLDTNGYSDYNFTWAVGTMDRQLSNGAANTVHYTVYSF